MARVKEAKAEKKKLNILKAASKSTSKTDSKAGSEADTKAGSKQKNAGKARYKKARINIREGGLLDKLQSLFAGFDVVVIVLVLLLCAFGIIMVYSASSYTTIDDNPSYYAVRQIVWILSGLVILIILANFDYHKYYKIANTLMIASLVMLVLVLLIGINVNGAQRWLGYGSARITPSELSKIFMIIWTSIYISIYPESVKKNRKQLVLWAVLAAHFILVFEQPNLSTAIVIAAIMFVIMLIAGLNPAWIFVCIGGVGAGAFGILHFLNEDHHWYRRLTSFINPFEQAQDEGYQLSQSLIALGNGGIKGMGLGNSTTKNLYLPEPQNDFILSIFCEELGYIGFLVLILVYFFLLYRMMLIALKARDKLGLYLASGVVVLFGLQIAINVAVVTASMPVTGITLPFISYGGSSMWTLMAAVGILLNVSKYNNKIEAKK